jgi:Arc/MetJ family transcription regulator
MGIQRFILRVSRANDVTRAPDGARLLTVVHERRGGYRQSPDARVGETRNLPGCDDPPTTPPSAADYTCARLPWFEYYADGRALEGGVRLNGLRSVAQLGRAKGDVPPPENESADPEKRRSAVQRKLGSAWVVDLSVTPSFLSGSGMSAHGRGHTRMEVVTSWCTFHAYFERRTTVRTTINLDDELLARAHEMTGIQEPTALIHEALRRLIQLEASRRLAKLGGTEPDLEVPPRRRSDPRKRTPSGKRPAL